MDGEQLQAPQQVECLNVWTMILIWLRWWTWL
jgi:hypothetical protein